MKKIMPAIIAIVLIFAVIAITFGMKLIDRFSYSDERADLSSYYNLSDDAQMALVYNQEILEEKGIWQDGHCYVSMDVVHNYFNDRFYADTNEKLLLYALPEELVSVSVGQSGEDGYVQAVEVTGEEGTEVYVALDYVQEFTNMNFVIYENPNRAVIETQFGEKQAVSVKKDTQVREKGGIKSSILTDVTKDSQLYLLEEMETWDKVMTEDGFIGYVEKKRLSDPFAVTTATQKPYTEPEYTSIHRDYKINMGWHQISSEAGNSTFESAVAETQGLNVISPTWFFLYDNNGSFESIASKEYVEKAHAMGLEVWALFNNFNYDGVDTHEVLSYTSKRQMIIQNLMNIILEYDIDGINMDFEELDTQTGEHYVEFLRELSIECRKNGIVLSVDNYAPESYNSHYGWEEQGVIADYVVIMGYDEHYAGSEEAGSVASLDFVTKGINTMLEYVPAEKIINAVPFYTRIWKSGNGTLESEAVGMKSAKDFLANNGVSAEWDDSTGQNYGEFEQDGILYQVWLEDAESLEAKLSVMQNAGIAGVAEWKLGFEKGEPGVWEAISRFVSGG